LRVKGIKLFFSSVYLLFFNGDEACPNSLAGRAIMIYCPVVALWLVLSPTTLSPTTLSPTNLLPST
jgi:hypothetical protein